MNELKKDLILHFYSEALKHDIKSSEFSDSAKKVSSFYRESFGMNETWQNYHSALRSERKIEVLTLFKTMFSALLNI